MKVYKEINYYLCHNLKNSSQRGRKDPAMDWLFVFTQIHVKILISNTIIIRDGVFERKSNHENGAMWDTRELACSLLVVSPLFKDTARCPSVIQEERTWPGWNSVNFSASRTMRNTFLLLNLLSLWQFVMAAPLKWAHIYNFTSSGISTQ